MKLKIKDCWLGCHNSLHRAAMKLKIKNWWLWCVLQIINFCQGYRTKMCVPCFANDRLFPLLDPANIYTVPGIWREKNNLNIYSSQYANRLTLFNKTKRKLDILSLADVRGSLTFLKSCTNRTLPSKYFTSRHQFPECVFFVCPK